MIGEYGAIGAIEAHHLIIEICDGETRGSRVVIVCRIYAHAAARLAVFTEGDTGAHGDLLKLSVAQVAVELIGLGIVGYEEVGPAVLIIIEHGDAERFGGGVKQAGLGGDIFKAAIAFVAEE